MKFDARNIIDKRIVIYTNWSASLLNQAIKSIYKEINIYAICYIDEEQEKIEIPVINFDDMLNLDKVAILIAQDDKYIKETIRLLSEKQIMYDHIHNYSEKILIQRLNLLNYKEYIDINGNKIKFESINPRGNIIISNKGGGRSNIVELGNISVSSMMTISLFGDNSITKIGDSSFFEVNILQTTNTEIEIGNDCMFSHGITLSPTDQHLIFDLNTRKRVNISKKMVVGNHVWCGRSVSLLGGAKIADNCVIGAGSVTAGKFDDKNCVIAGNPAKVIRRNILWARDSQQNDYMNFEQCSDQTGLKYIESEQSHRIEVLYQQLQKIQEELEEMMNSKE